MSSLYEDYDNMPDLEQATSTQQEAAAPIVPSITLGGPPSSHPQAAISATTTSTEQDNQNDGSTPTPAIHTPWGSFIPLPATGPLASISAGTGLSQYDPSALPPHPFLLFPQALDALGPPPDFEAVVNSPDDPALPAEPNDLFIGLAAMLSAPPGAHDDSEDDDAWGDESGDGQDDMPSLETAVLSTTPLPPAVEGMLQDNLAHYMTNIFLPLGPMGTAPMGTQGSPADQTPPVAPLGSVPSASPATPTTTTSQNGSGGVPNASASAASEENLQNGPSTDQPALPPPFPTAPSSVFGPAPMIGPDGTLVDASGVTYNTVTTSIEELAASLSGNGNLPPNFVQMANMFAQMFSVVSTDSPPPADWPLIAPLRRTRFNAARFVSLLEKVEISTIAAEDMRCPHCWLQFGTMDEDDSAFVFAPDPDDPPELAARQIAFRELPFCAAWPDNDPIRTPCGHLFGRSCLIETMEKVDTLCPTCRQELRPKPKVPNATE